jgi:tetratricopeptide (TPR) repeat protein
MRSIVRLGAVAFLLVGGAGIASADALQEAQTHYAAVRNEATCPQAAAAALAFASSGAFAQLDAQQRSSLLYQTLICAWRSENAEVALAASELAVTQNMSWARRLRLAVAISFENGAVAGDAFNALTAEEVSSLEGWQVWRVIGFASDADPSGAQALAVHERLLAVGFYPSDGGHDDGLRLAHARLLLEAGETERALDRLRGMVSASSWLSVRVDRRFDPVRAQLEIEGRLDLVAAAEAELARARDDVRANPNQLWPMSSVVGALRVLGRWQEALEELQPVLRAAQTMEGPQRFEDHAEQLNWLLNQEAYVLYDLGRVEDAHVAFRFAIMAREDGQPSVSQVINFASMLEKEGRAQEALDTLAEVGRASPYGEMWIASVRTCAAEQLDRNSLRDEGLAFLRANETDNAAALSAALLCVNALDEAAALFIRRLGNPDERDGALTALQIYEQNFETARVLPRTMVIAERLAAIRDRPEVRAAVDHVGRIERAPIHATYWGDY